MNHVFLIFLGGGLGSVARWGLSSGIQTLAKNTALELATYRRSAKLRMSIIQQILSYQRELETGQGPPS